jgi:hypothetical protein
MEDEWESSNVDGPVDVSEALAAARRPAAIARHRDLIAEMEESLSDMLITGGTDPPRLNAMLEELESDSEQQRIKETITALSDQETYGDHSLQDALIEHLCLLREDKGIEVATLQLHVIGIYRFVRSMMDQQQFVLPTIDDLRALPAAHILRLTQPQRYTFGSSELSNALVFAPTQAKEIFDAIRNLNNREPMDDEWDDDNGRPALSRAEEEPLAILEPDDLEAARQKLVCAKIRSRFYRSVFTKYLAVDELSPEEIGAHRTVLHWLESISETPHLYPFMQGQSDGQKHFRIRQLLRKIIQLNEIYQRIEHASRHPTYTESFQGGDLKASQKLKIMSKDRYPMLPVDNQFTITTLLCPFSAFAAWVQEQVTSDNFLIPPDGKKK